MADLPSSSGSQDRYDLTGKSLRQNSTQVITEANVLITEILAGRLARQPDLAAENQALHTLAQQLTDAPQSMLKTLVRIARDICRADTAGVSFLETLPDGTSVFRWVAIAGALESLEQTTTPGNFSPCGTTIHCGQPQLYARPELYFTYLHHPQFSIVEELLLPLCVNNQQLGTIWIISHNEQRQFDREDQRLMTSLAGFTASALHSIHLRQTAELALQREQAARLETEVARQALDEAAQRTVNILESFTDAFVCLDQEWRITYANQQATRLNNLKPEEMIGKTHWEMWPWSVGTIVEQTYRQVVADQVAAHFEVLYEPLKMWLEIHAYPAPVGLSIYFRDITERRQMKVALHESQNRSQTMLANMPGMVYRYMPSANGLQRFTFVSSGCQDLFEVEPETALQNANSIWNLIHPDDRPSFESSVATAVEHFLHWDWRGRFITPSGQLKWIQGRSRAVDTPDGVVWDGFVFDVTGRKQAEDALRESEEFNRSVVESSADCIKVLDLDGCLLSMNGPGRCLMEIEDCTPLIGTSWIEFWQDSDRTNADNAVNTAKAGGTSQFSGYCPTAKGTPKSWDVVVTPILDVAGKPKQLLVVSRDITDRKRAEEAILERSRLSALSADIGTILIQNDTLLDTLKQCTEALVRHLDAAFARIWTLNREKNLLELQASAGMYTHLNGSHSQVPVGQFKIGLIAQERQPRLTNSVNGDPRIHDQEWVAREGIVAFAGYPLIVENQVVGVMALFSRHWLSEITLQAIASVANAVSSGIQRKQIAIEREQLLEQEQAAREEAEAANRIKDEFLAVLSHELRSPLNPILGWSSLLQTRKLDEAKQAQALVTIHRNAKLQSELIEDLLDVSRILRGKLSLNVVPVNLAATIQAAIETVRLAAEAKSIQIQPMLDPEVGQVSADPTRLQQVIWNLLSNAVKFTSEGGQVNIRLERLGSHAQISVSDTGQGIDPDFLPYVFDYFRQASATTTRKFGGLGLGLAIVRHLVELHGGTVRAESLGEAQGATFTVRLPLMPTQPTANQDSTLPEMSLDLSNIKILVVDDDTDTREFIAFLLEQYGARVTAVASAHEALTALTQSKPNVLLSDIGMPDIDGYMLIQQVRTLLPEQCGQIPAIALTAYAGEMNQQQALAAGFQKHISKPIEPRVLVQAISSLARSALKCQLSDL